MKPHKPFGTLTLQGDVCTCVCCPGATGVQVGRCFQAGSTNTNNQAFVCNTHTSLPAYASF